MRRRFAVALVPLFACGGDGAAEEARCHVAATYSADEDGIATVYFDQAGSGAGSSESLQYLSDLTIDAGLALTIRSGTEDFPGTTVGPKPNISLASASNAQNATCGACVELGGHLGGDAEYRATSGTLTVTSTGGTFEGTLTNVGFTHVTTAPDGTSSAVGDDCTTTITSLSFSAQIAPEGGSGVAPGHI